jgi:hypothetical protein
MQPIPSTAQILAYKALNLSVDADWVTWAVDMLMAGFDTENLIILAGISSFDNQFELSALTNKVLDELQLDYSDQDKTIKNYVSYLVMECLAMRRDPIRVLYFITDIYNGTGHSKSLQDFFLLYWAKQDLLTDENQWYWPNADRNNIDSIITNYFTQWLKDNPVMF